MKAFALIAAGFATLGASPAWAGDEICARIEAFQRAPFEEGGAATPARWVEVRWEGNIGGADGWGLACTRSEDDASAQLCDWLVGNTSMEFSGNLPKRILECFGYAFPSPWSGWREWRSDLDLVGAGRPLLLQIDLTEAAPSRVVRLVSFAEGQSEATVDLPPLNRIEPGEG